MGCSFALLHIVKENLIEVNVVVVNMLSRSMVGITTLNKSQALLKFFLNLVQVQTTTKFLNYQLTERPQHGGL